MKQYCGMRMTPEALAWCGIISAHEYIELTNAILEREVSSEARKLMRESALATHERLRKQRESSVIVGAE